MKLDKYFDHTAEKVPKEKLIRDSISEACRQGAKMAESRKMRDLKGLYEASRSCFECCAAVLGSLSRNRNLLESAGKLLKEAVLNEALVYYEKEKFSEAIDCLDRAGELSDPVYRVMYGSCLFEKERYREAFKRLLLLEKEDVWPEKMDIYEEGITARGCLQLAMIFRTAELDDARAKRVIIRWMERISDKGIRKVMADGMIEHRRP